MSHYRKKRPPKRRLLTESELSLLESLGGVRLPMKDIASMFKMSNGNPMSLSTLEETINYQEAARDALMRGRARAKGKIHSTLFQLATGERDETNKLWKVKPDMSALRFWCETQEGFKRSEAADLTDALKTSSLPPEEREAEIKRLLAQRSLTYEE
jgi:hypothetical protein